MYTDKDSNLISDLRTKYGEDISHWPDEAASVWLPVKACQWFYNDFTLFQHFQFLFIMYTDSDSNLISDIQHFFWNFDQDLMTMV